MMTPLLLTQISSAVGALAVLGLVGWTFKLGFEIQRDEKKLLDDIAD